MKFSSAKADWLFRYGLAVALFGAVLGLSYLLRYVDFRLNLTIPIIVALVTAAWYGGIGPGLLISVLFQGTTIFFAVRPPDPSLAKSIFTWASVFALYVFIAGVISRLKIIQTRLRDQRDLLQVTLESIGDGVITTQPNEQIVYLNRAAEQMTGWTQNNAVGRPLSEVFNVRDEATRAPLTDLASRAIEQGSVIGPFNHSVLESRDGRTFSIVNTAAPIVHNGTTRGAVMIFSDVSERKRAEQARRESEMMQRVIAAQEAERYRIARDLHDHLGQKMTALRLKLETLTQAAQVSPRLLPVVGDVRAAASDVDRDIDYISWELRPTELEHLGLSDALASFVREWSRHYGIPAEYHGPRETMNSAGGRLAEQLETNLYRITQEALHNVLKHAEADYVNVLLQRRQDQLVLIVEDNGKGFADILSTGGDSSNGRRHGGLGLIGMQERAAILKGVLEIDSRRGAGTTIMARIPLN